MIKFNKIIYFRKISKIKVKHKGSSLTITKLHRRYFSRKLPRFESYSGWWFPKLIKTKIFSNLAIKSPLLTHWYNLEVLYNHNIWIYFYILDLWRVSKIFAEVLFHKIWGFYYKQNIELFWLTSFPAHLIAKEGGEENIFLKLLWGRSCCFGMKKLKELLCIFFWKFLEVSVDFLSKVLLNGCIWKYPTKQKHVQ